MTEPIKQKSTALTQEQIVGLINQNLYLKEVQDLNNEAVFRQQLLQLIRANTQAMTDLTATLKEGLVSEDQQQEEESQTTEDIPREEYQPSKIKKLPTSSQKETEEDEDEDETEEEDDEPYEYKPKRDYHAKK